MKKLTGINGNVFVRRDEDEEEMGGITFSQKLVVKSSMGVVEATPTSYKIVTSGDRIHLPHYDVGDFIFDGTECA